MPASDATLEREWPVLLAACSLTSREDQIARLRALSATPLDWCPLFELAKQHGVQPLLHHALLGTDFVPADAMDFLTQACQTNLHKTLLLSRELIRIVEHLSQLGIDVIPYKGPSLAETIYGDIALRQSGDIDLLVRPQDLVRVRNAVRDLGYTPHAVLSEAEERAFLKSGYEFAFDGPGGPNLLEMQWGIVPRFYSVDFDVDGMFHRSILLPVAGKSMKSLSYEDSFFVLAVHAAKHAWGRLIWLCDLARLMNRDLNWDWIGAEAQRLGIARIVRVTMILANHLLGAGIPSAAQKTIPDDTHALPIAEEIQNQMASATAYRTESVAYFRLMMRLRERSTDRIRFLQRLVFTPGPSEWKAVRLPAPLFPLYKLVRLSRLARRLVRAQSGE